MANRKIIAEEIIAALNLKLHPEEGGFFAETHRSEEWVPAEALPDRYRGGRSFGTCIYYLLTPDAFSALHRLESDEVFHFYLGDPVEMLQLWPDGSGRVLTLGDDIPGGMRPQIIVPKGVWQGSRLRPGGRFCLMGATVSPGFEYADYEAGKRDDLIRVYPAFADRIARLTP
ncbi:MAG: cupin domain-containing protein [Candidatus Tectomicrobia bacterium]|nr:cupin domain-containing protein [Candidatus Tectomicrobia bacterium]